MVGAIEAGYGSLTWLEQLRALLALGFLAALVLAFMSFAEAMDTSTPSNWPTSPKPKASFCKLHSRPEDQCRDMHDPPTDGDGGAP